MINNSTTSSVDYSSLVKLAKSFRRPDEPYILANPHAFDSILEDLKGLKISEQPNPFYGIPVYTNYRVPAYGKKWKFPADPFVEYEAKDEEWARPIHFGKEVDDPNKPVVYAVNSGMYASPLKPIESCEDYTSK